MLPPQAAAKVAIVVNIALVVVRLSKCEGREHSYAIDDYAELP